MRPAASVVLIDPSTSYKVTIVSQVGFLLPILNKPIKKIKLIIKIRKGRFIKCGHTEEEGNWQLLSSYLDSCLWVRLK